MTDNLEHTTILFDGVCNFCDGSVNWIIRRDPEGRFRFAPLQSAAGERLQRAHGLAPNALDTLVLIEGGRAHTKSGAALRILRQMPFPWPAAFALMVVPAPARDFVYDFFARRRYRWFGRKDECMVPRPGVRERFLLD
jgi:predicted DCC family thiol-disulfide oxidoreductase YuxK